MKALIWALIIIFTLIGTSIATGASITVNLNSNLATAYEDGLEEGQTQGYQMGFLEGSRAGYQEGGRTGYETAKEGYYGSYGKTFYFAYNPTHDEVREFLAEYEKASIMEIHDYAEANGFRTAYVRVVIARQAAEGMVWVYQLIAFRTTDNGLVIIEPWSHREVKLEVGQRYSELNGFLPTSYDDTIAKVNIVW